MAWAKRGLTVLVAVTAATAGAATATPAMGQGSDGSVPAPDPQPRIALVLGGGGARGMAHVGALKALEELRIPIDLVVGTSMGAVVGGMYAAGLSPQEIEGEMAMIDWPLVFDDRGRRESLSFRRKDQDLRTLSGFEMGFRNGRLTPPRGLLAGQKFNFLLTAYTLRVAGIQDFDHLPIPYRAVATDLEDGRWVALAGGDLAEAIRASLSIPGVFAPVEIGGRLLVDGGLANNLPTDVALQLGADIVIAVDVGTPLAGRDGLGSVVGVASQISGLLTRKGVEARLPLADVVITPDLAGFRTSDFVRAMDIVPRGEEAVRRQSAELARFAVGEGEFETFLRRQRRPPPEAIEIAFIQVEGPTSLDSRVVTHRIRMQPGKPLDLEALLEDLGRLYELGDFERVIFRLVPQEEQWGILIRAEEKDWGRSRLRFAFNFNEEFHGPNSLNVLLQHTWNNLNARRGEVRTELQLGRTHRVQTEFYQPLDFASRYFVLPVVTLHSTTVDVFEDFRQVAEYRVNAGTGAFFLGANLGSAGEARFGLQWGRGRTKVAVGAPGIPESDVTSASWVARVVVDTLDDGDIPHRGVLAVAEAMVVRKFLGGDEAYEKVRLDAGRWFSRGRQTYFLELDLGSSLNSTLPPYDLFSLGGLLSFSGLRRGALAGQHFAVGRAGFYRLIAGPGSGFVRAVYAGGWLEMGNAWMDRQEARFGDLRWTATVALGMRTAVGPLYLAYGVTEGHSGQAHVLFGKKF